MRKIVYALMVSLDGCIEGPDGGLNWSVPSEELHKHFNDLYLTGEIDTSLYGRGLYEIMAGYWPSITDESDVPEVEKEYARIWKKVTKIVYSKTLNEAEWSSKLEREIDPDEIRKLKEQPGGLIEVGGANLAASFLKLGLVDQLWLYVHPAVLGGGKSYFPAGLNLKLTLMDTQTFSSEVVRMRYTIDS
jgi:dihydrofolate reductase